MGKGGKVLALIAILIGAGGLAFGFFAWNSVNKLQTELDNIESLNNVWYNKSIGVFTLTPAFTWLEIPNLIVKFTLESNASIYLSFTGRATVFSDLDYSRVLFSFKIDGEQITDPMAMVGTYEGGSTSVHFSVHLQHFIENMGAGSHNVTIFVIQWNTVLPPYLRENSIFVQSFAP
ncbi:hypothetical protein LCGC14_1852570 [marine sediment metagenome]|uniref:Carbohydrate binding module xylan-binding domain-containing protein n=1 Tax=marine sediment metagenome TaxID=412755 RepID=A0A0F9G9U1_9ZZZZ